ncbi:MAG TPA: MBL fold metallo-hydrolase [Verrucomicrobiae bacterium]|jgi:glyoxylase-like metal-dependent hydrolase (beta-lactamase superfamily II)|nr:MBL fold metallo-hydrolase [Verrucomicrobiae bacterium]
MNLEDHLGDIIRKGRKAANVSADAAAKAAGISTDELNSLEESGKTSAKPNLAALASLLGLSPAKLEGIAKGWLPSPKDLSKWIELRKFETEQGGMAVNSYLAWDEVSREAAMFDTGWNVDEAVKTITDNQLQLKHIFLTHSHDDHIAGLAALREKFSKAHVHSNSKSAPPQSRNRPNDFTHLGSLRITNRDTPGHAEDGVTYVIGNWPEDAPHVAIVGDAIFAGSIGSGFISWDVAKQKVRDQIFSLPADTLICSGHGPFTTVGEEKAHNPFFV